MFEPLFEHGAQLVEHGEVLGGGVDVDGPVEQAQAVLPALAAAVGRLAGRRDEAVEQRHRAAVHPVLERHQLHALADPIALLLVGVVVVVVVVRVLLLRLVRTLFLFLLQRLHSVCETHQ